MQDLLFLGVCRAGPQEDRDTVELLGLRQRTEPGPAQLLGAAVVPEHGRDPLVERDAEVVVEGAAGRGVPGEGPPHPGGERRQLGVGRPRDRDQGRVPGVQVREVADGVGVERAAGTGTPPAGAEHQVQDDQLAAAVEQLGQRPHAVRAGELVGLLDPDRGQRPASPVDPVPPAGLLLLQLKEGPPRGQPGGAVDDRGWCPHACYDRPDGPNSSLRRTRPGRRGARAARRAGRAARRRGRSSGRRCARPGPRRRGSPTGSRRSCPRSDATARTPASRWR